jgi:predicted RNA binding protein YcfA (HicA-like mRNA interferase family)
MMRTGGAKGSHIHSLVEALEEAGYSLARRSSSHYIFKAPDRPSVTIPEKLDDRHLARKIAKAAGVAL